MKIKKIDCSKTVPTTTEIVNKINEIIDILNNSFITVEHDEVFGQVTTTLLDLEERQNNVETR